jgi:hypothetical protein
MTTVIAVYNSDGCVGRCDANCHNARTAHCTCICGGRLHGASRGGRSALDKNTRDLLGDDMADLLRAFAESHGVAPEDCRVEFPAQLELLE